MPSLITVTQQKSLWSRVKRRIRNLLLACYTTWFAKSRGVRVGSGSVIHPGAQISKIGGGNIKIGRNCVLHRNSLLATYGGWLSLGDDVTVNDFSILYGHGGLSIGNGTRIAAHVVVIPANHGTKPDLPIHVQPMETQGIEVGADVWIGSGVRILDGAKIADGCVLAAGAVILPDLNTEPLAIYGGIPARRIGSRSDGVKGSNDFG